MITFFPLRLKIVNLRINTTMPDWAAQNIQLKLKSMFSRNSLASSHFGCKIHNKILAATKPRCQNDCDS